MKISRGQVAPTFVGSTSTGEPLSLEDFRGQKVWLGFYRWSSCPLCNLRISEVITRYQEFEDAGIQLIAVFQSPAENVSKYVGQQQPPFPIVADPEQHLYKAYGVEMSVAAGLHPRVFTRTVQAAIRGFIRLNYDPPLFRIPAHFLVDPNGVVWKAYYGETITDHIPFEHVTEFGNDLGLG